MASTMIRCPARPTDAALASAWPASCPASVSWVWIAAVTGVYWERNAGPAAVAAMGELSADISASQTAQDAVQAVPPVRQRQRPAPENHP